MYVMQHHHHKQRIQKQSTFYTTLLCALHIKGVPAPHLIVVMEPFFGEARKMSSLTSCKLLVLYTVVFCGPFSFIHFHHLTLKLTLAAHKPWTTPVQTHLGTSETCIFSLPYAHIHITHTIPPISLDQRRSATQPMAHRFHFSTSFIYIQLANFSTVQ